MGACSSVDSSEDKTGDNSEDSIQSKNANVVETINDSETIDSKMVDEIVAQNRDNSVLKYRNNGSKNQIQAFAYPRLRDESAPLNSILRFTTDQTLRVWKSILLSANDRPFFVLDLSGANILVNASHFCVRKENPLTNSSMSAFNFDGRRKGVNHWRMLRYEQMNINDVDLCPKFIIYNNNEFSSLFDQYRVILNVDDRDNQLHVKEFDIFGVESKGMDEKQDMMLIQPPTKEQNSFSRYLFSDYGGIIHWLAYDCGRDWQPKSPLLRGLCTVTASSVGYDSNFDELVSGSPINDRSITENKEDSWFMIDLSAAGIKVNITHYALRHYQTWNGYALRNWRFEVFNTEDNDWILLMEHVNDEHLYGRGSAHLWTLKNETEIFIDKLRITQSGLNSSGDHRLALGALEIFGIVHFMDDVQEIKENNSYVENDEKNDAIAKNEEYNQKNMNIFIEKLGLYLQMFAEGMKNDGKDWLNIDMIQMMNTYDILFNRNHEYQSTEDIFHEISDKYFNGEGCDLKECESVFRNTRDRMKEEEKEKEEEYNINNRHRLCMIRILDAIHCSVMHAYDTGMKLSKKERDIIYGQSSNTNNNLNTDENEEDDESLYKDTESIQTKNILHSRNTRYSGMRKDQTSNTIQSNKFMTVVENDIKSDDNKKEEVIYSFGYPFKYNEEYDKYSKQRNEFYIPAKFENIKEEICFNSFCDLPITEFDCTHDRAVQWMHTRYIREMIIRGVLIHIKHILSVMFYCNYTRLSTIFSSTFRRVSGESLDEMIVRHSNVREWGRLLKEAVNDYGQSLDKSPIKVFYHGISIPMLFSSCYARFLCPTSTTATFSVANRFAKSGIILELANNNSKTIRFFDCVMLSDFSNEDEKLFLGNYHPLPFHSIRHIEYRHDYKYFISAICKFEQMINGNLYIFVMKKHGRSLQKMIDCVLNESGKCPEYVVKLFEKYCKSVKKYKINIQHLNERYSAFLRLCLYEKYDEKTIAKNKEKWKHKPKYSGVVDIAYINSVRLIRVDLITKLFPNLKYIDVRDLPLTAEVMDNVMQFVANESSVHHTLQKITMSGFDSATGGEFQSQSTMDFEECKSKYEKQLNEFNWELGKGSSSLYCRRKESVS